MLDGRLTDAEAAVLAEAGPEAVRLALLAANARIASLAAAAAAAAAASSASPSTPSGMVPVHEKPSVPKGKRKRRKPPGAKDGHPGTRRKPPAEVDAREEHRLDACPCCGGT